MALFKSKRLRLNLALQGGGAHGAFTWGVLDRLLEEEGLQIDTVSGTSAGAVNAVALADGYAEGGADGARSRLTKIWQAVEEAARTAYGSFNPFEAGLRGMEAIAGATMSRLSGAFSPYETNPLDINPLRNVLEDQIDFARISGASEIKLAIAATDVETGVARIFDTREITADVVLASSCLPAIHRAVEIDGRKYWDGGFSANPDLLSFARLSDVDDNLLVMIDPLVQEGLPTTPQDIAAAIARITFNQPLLRDIALIEAVREASGLTLRPSSEQERLARQRFHLIDAGHHTSRLPPQSKFKPDADLLKSLHLAGRLEADHWLKDNARHIGWRETVNLKERFLGVRPDPSDHAKSA